MDENGTSFFSGWDKIHFEFEGQRHFLKFYYSSLEDESFLKDKATAIAQFLSEKYPNIDLNQYDLDELEWDICRPCAFFSDHLIKEHSTGDYYSEELELFTNQIHMWCYACQPELRIKHHDLNDALFDADKNIVIHDEFKSDEFHLVSFTTKYIAHTAYAFIGHSDPIFGCMVKKDIRRIAENYMGNAQYKQWFGARLSIVR